MGRGVAILEFGAGEGNRTLVCSLGSCRSAIELRPRNVSSDAPSFDFITRIDQKLRSPAIRENPYAPAARDLSHGTVFRDHARQRAGYSAARAPEQDHPAVAATTAAGENFVSSHNKRGRRRHLPDAEFRNGASARGRRLPE